MAADLVVCSFSDGSDSDLSLLLLLASSDSVSVSVLLTVEFCLDAVLLGGRGGLPTT